VVAIYNINTVASAIWHMSYSEQMLFIDENYRSVKQKLFFIFIVLNKKYCNKIGRT